MGTPNTIAILVIDPNAAARAHVRQAVSEHAQVTEVQTVAEAIQQLMRRLPAVIVLEWDLPDGDGVAFIRQLRAEPKLQGTVIACVSHASGMWEKIRVLQAGADDYVVQPIDRANYWVRLELLRRMRKLAPWPIQ
jgi:DNA-binding response OmpR family regulator